MRKLRKLALFGALSPGMAHGLTDSTRDVLLAEEGWTQSAEVKEKQVGTVTIHKRTVAGNPCYRAVAKAQLSVKRLLEVVSDVEAEPDYLSEGPTISKLLAQKGEETVYVQYLDVPGWTFMSDRFWFARASVLRTANETHLVWEGLADPATEYPTEYDAMRREHPKALQPELNIGAWSFRHVDGWTHMRYTLCTDVGGRVPQWVQNAATRSTLPAVVRDVILEAQRRDEAASK